METSTALDPEVAAVVEQFQGVPAWHTMSVSCARRLEDDLFGGGDGPEPAWVRDIAVDGPGGDLPMRIYAPTTDRTPVVVFYHGGGWTLGTLDSADDICRELAVRTGCRVVSVDYRLAPDHPFPAPLDDALAALSWVTDHVEQVGGDPDRVAVAGTSAGGNLAAATALRAPESLDGQLLLYPILDHGFETDSYKEHAGAALLSRADMEWFWEQYLRSPVDAANPYASVLRAEDLSDAPSATVLTAGHDVLRSEGVAYADRLREAGVETTHHHYPALAHGFLSMTDEVARADEAMERLAEAVRDRLDAA